MVTRQDILSRWRNQNPKLVKALKAQGLLESRLTAAEESVNLVAGASLARGLNQSQADELALDAVGLEVRE